MGGLPRRDLWLLPLISVLTALGLLAGAEVVSRLVWPGQVSNACRMPDPVLGYRYRPNCSAVMKTPEGPWYTSAYNSCGYRSTAPCGPKPVGSHRIALIGSSTSEGYLVEYQDTIGARVGMDLTRMCRAPVEVQNLGGPGYIGDRLMARMDEALRLRPDAVLLLITPFDVEDASAGKVGAEKTDTSIQKRLFDALKGSRALGMAESFLFRDPSVYLPLYLRYGDKADFLRPPFTARWRERLDILDRLVEGLADRAHRANVPLTVAFVPQEAQVAMMAPGRTAPPGIEPTALPKAIEAITTRHGAEFADTTQALSIQPAPEKLYYQVDGHLAGTGQPIAATVIARTLANQGDGPFANCRAADSVSLEVRR
jgi:hypothetical protein